MTRYVTHEGVTWVSADLPDPTPDWPENQGLEERFRLYRLCSCDSCSGTGKKVEVGTFASAMDAKLKRCSACRGEGRALDLIATASDAESVGVALITLGREGEWKECPIGILDTQGAKGQKWVVSPWLPSPRNISDAGRLLQTQRHHQ